jgi:serine/threonine protein kinase
VGLAAARHAGQTFGGYQLQTLLGIGGMGEVYLAHDTKLRRDVAIKVLPQEFTSDPDRLARFEREARMLATLNHPNICGIYGVDEQAGTRYLVLELVDGETVAARLADTAVPLTVQDALEIARQIAEALEAAHERGVIHRDLKPSNVKITSGHVVKVLDFGLAKTVGGAGAASDLTHASDVELGGRPGQVIGTAAYMSPEQARGLPVDKRTDIWAFGVVLFEMIAGVRPFSGESASETIAGILKSEPEWGELSASVSPGLRQLLHRCLDKDPRRRLQSIAEARVQIENLLRGDDDPLLFDETPRGVSGRVGRTLTGRTRLAWTVAASAVIAAAVLAALLLARQGARFQLQVPPPPGASLVTEESPMISPDGARLAFVGYDAGGTQRLFLFLIGSKEPPEPLPKTEGASLPFWSADSHGIGFFAQGFLKTIDIYTRHTRQLAPAGGPRGGTWSTDDVILFVPSPLAGPYRISAKGDGADLNPVPSDASGPRGGWFPSFLPDGRHFLEFHPTTLQPENSGVWVVSLESGKRVRVVPSQSNATYAHGQLLFWLQKTLWVQAFDETTHEVSGTPRRVADSVGLNPVTNQALFSVSSSGRLAYFAGTVGHTALTWFGREGNVLSRPGPTGVISTLSLSPDDTSVAYDLADPQTATFDIWTQVFGRPEPQRVTVNPSNDVFPLFSPDGQRLAFMSVRDRPPQIYEMPANTSGNESRLFSLRSPVVPTGYMMNPRTLFYTVLDPTTATGDIGAYSFETKLTTLILRTSKDERYATPSPDGRWLAYVSNASGSYEVYVRALQASGVGDQISKTGGTQPQWSRDGYELIYMALDRSLMSVAVKTSREALAFAPPRRLFRTQTKSLEVQGTTRTYAISRDAKRFLVANATDEARYARIEVVLNWMTDLDK